MIRIKRIYESPTREPGDGKRVLVDRLWPRGLKKEGVAVDEWLKDIAPSNELRRWFGHDPLKWEEFRKRYRQELSGKEVLLEELRKEGRGRALTILYSAKDEEHNNAVALREFLSEKTK